MSCTLLKSVLTASYLALFCLPVTAVPSAASPAPQEPRHAIASLRCERPLHKGPQGADEAAKRELTDLLQQFAAASIRGDDAFFDRVLADDYTFVTTKGEYKNKAQALADYRSHSIKFRSHVFDRIDVRVYGDTAVVTNRALSVSSFKGKPRNGVTLNTRVFVRRDGRWQCVAFQSTNVQAAADHK